MPDICQALIIDAPAETVFTAITSQQGLAGWWTPNVSAEPREGSVARFGFGPTYVKEMRIDEIDPWTTVRWSCISGADEWVGTTITFQLDAGNRASLLQLHPEATGQIEQAGGLETGTLLMFSHDGWRGQTPMFAECSYTWGRFLHSLKLLCETGTGQPSPHEHAVDRLRQS